MRKKLGQINNGIIKEFKTFITRGNVMDLAVGVIVGAAFNKIVTSLVNDIITPLISFIMGLFTPSGFDLAKWSLKLREGAVLNIGQFIAYVIDFLITAFALFLFVKAFNKLNSTADKLLKKEEKEEEKEEENSGGGGI